MKKINFSILALFILALSSCNFNINCTDIEGDTITRELDFDSFNELKIAIPARVIVSEGENQSVSITGPNDLIDLIEEASNVNGSLLTFTVDGCVEYQQNDLEITIKANSLSKLEIDGSADISSSDTLSASESFEIEISGSGDIDIDLGPKTNVEINTSGSGNLELSGSCSSQSIGISGSGKIFNRALITSETEITISGSGRAELNVVDNLNITISGSGNICYDGNPSITQEISGSGSIAECQ